MRVIKMVHALIHKCVFIFHKKEQVFQDLSQMILNVFRFESVQSDQASMYQTTERKLLLNSLELMRNRESEASSEYQEDLRCSDIIFVVLNYVFNRTEPLVNSFR